MVSRRQSSGFTLLELLIAISISAVMAMGLYGLYDAVLDISDFARKKLAVDMSDRIVYGILTNDLANVVVDPEGGQDFAFQARSAHSSMGEPFLEFATTASLDLSAESTAVGGIQHVQYFFRAGPGDAKLLVRKERPYCGLTGDWKAREYVIAEEVREVQVEYADPAFGGFVSELDEGKPQGVLFSFLLEVEGKQKQCTYLAPVRFTPLQVEK